MTEKWHDMMALRLPNSGFSVAIVLSASARAGQKTDPCRSDLGIVNWIVGESEVKLRVIELFRLGKTFQIIKSNL